MDWRKYRSHFPSLERITFLNHAGVCLLSNRVLSAIQKALESGMTGVAPYEELDRSRELFSRIINARPDEVALVPSTTYGINLVASSLKISKGDRVVLNDLEFPSNVYPWLKLAEKGAEVTWIRSSNGMLSLEDYEKALRNGAKVVPISHVQWCTGFRVDLKALSELAHEHGALLVVDAMQSVGALQVDVKRCDIDILVCGSHKWLLGPEGAAFLYVREDLVESIFPSFVGWRSVVHEQPDKFDLSTIKLHSNARRFELSTLPLICFVGLNASMEMLLEAGLENVEQRVLSLAERLSIALQDEGFTLQSPTCKEHMSGIVNVKVENYVEVVRELRKRNIIASARMNGVRVSPHFFNSEEDLDKFIRELKSLVE